MLPLFTYDFASGDDADDEKRSEHTGQDHPGQQQEMRFLKETTCPTVRIVQLKSSEFLKYCTAVQVHIVFFFQSKRRKLQRKLCNFFLESERFWTNAIFTLLCKVSAVLREFTVAAMRCEVAGNSHLQYNLAFFFFRQGMGCESD